MDLNKLAEKYDQLSALIIIMDKHMAEQFARHDYRSMYEIWEPISSANKEIIQTLAKPNQ